MAKSKKSTKTESTNLFQARQGDVLFTQLSQLPKLGDEIPVVKNIGCVFAFGEATGHHHSVNLKESEFVKMFKVAGATGVDSAEVVRVSQPVTVTHQEHGSFKLMPGDYLVSHQREYSPEAIRNVID